MSAGRQDGFSLVEVIVALGLLGAVLISISGLFVVGERQVQRGKVRSTALAAGRDIIEEMNGWSYEGLWETFGLTGTADSYTVDTRANTFASGWQPALDELSSGYALIRLESVDDAAPLPVLEDASTIRVRVTVYWNEGLAVQRSLELTTVRM